MKSIAAPTSVAPAVRSAASAPSATSAPAVPAAETAGEAPPKVQVSFLNAPVRKQAVLVILAAVFAGVLVGMIEAHLGHPGWTLLVLVSAVLLGVWKLARKWFVGPIESLLKDVMHADNIRRPTRRYDRPIDTTNEIHQLGEYIHRMSVEAYRQTTAVNHLRRTLDHRIAAATRKATQQLEQLAYRDPLTDLANRRFVQENLDNLISTCRAAHADLLCIAIDMDNFKVVNDRFGHAKGDELLVFLAQVMRANIRGEDYAVRLGGDEFLLFLPGCDSNKAAEITQRIAGLFQQHVRIALPSDCQASLSMGAASLLADRAANGAALMERADARLYEAKQQGKNQVVGL